MANYRITICARFRDGTTNETVSVHHANLVPLEAVGRAVRKHYGRGAYFRTGRQEPTGGNVIAGTIARDQPFKRAPFGAELVGSVETMILAHAVATVTHHRKVRP
jgi:hypothetical protein